MPAELGTHRLDEIIDRTTEGVEAALASLSPTEPERLGFLIAHDVTYFARLFGWKRALTVAEPLMLPMLAGTALRSERTGGKKLGLGLGLATGTAVQLARTDNPEKASAATAVAAATQYTSYSLAVRGTFDASMGLVGTTVRSGLVLAGVGLALWKNRDVALATALGGVPLVFASELASDSIIQKTGNVHSRGVGHGANLVFVGEALHLLRATLFKGRRGWGARLTEASAASMTALGQMLIVDGISKKG